MPPITNNKQNINKPRGLQKLSMVILATLPLLAWYKIPFPVGLGYALVLFLSAYTIFIRSFRINVFPTIFWCLFTYVCCMWIYNNDFALWTLVPPGGWLFFLFFLALIWGVLNFDLQLLKKYMRWVVLISAALFWIQFILKIFTGSQIFCFVPNLTGAFTYEGMSYAELAAHQMQGTRPCSIFLEPSYMAYYYIAYLALVWFGKNNTENWFNKEIIFVILSLIALQSGSGMVGLAILITVKLFNLFWTVNKMRKVLLITLALPLLISAIYIYIGSDMGQNMLSRSEEFSNEGSSGFTRVIGGFLMFDQLDLQEQMVGIPDARERFGIERWDGHYVFFANGVQTILLSLGYIGAILYFLFYASLFRKVGLSSKMCIIVLLVMALLESNYLNPYMMLLTIIPCAEYFYEKKRSVNRPIASINPNLN